MNSLKSAAARQAHPSFVEARYSSDVIEIAGEVFGDEAQAALEALAKPPDTYYVRCNTLKISPQELAAELGDQGLRVEQNTVLPEALGIPIGGPFEVSTIGKKVIVDKKTAESSLQGANVYAPGIIDCNAMRPGDQVSIFSEWGEIIASGKAMLSANEVLTFRKGMAVRVDSSRYKGPKVRELREFSLGLLYPQSLAAMVTSRVLDPKPNETVVDMNCAPGGKLTHLSQLMQNSGRIYAFDRNPEKVGQARRTVSALGCRNVTLLIHDSRYLARDFPDLKVDRVLVDPPCSALGLRPKIYDFTTRARTMNLADYQRQFLKSASEIVKLGGVIVYSVCTFTIQECEEIVDYAERECGLRTVEQNPILAARGLPLITPHASLCQRFNPQEHDIGYFIAKFERVNL